MSASGNWGFYLIGVLLILLGVAFVLIPLLAGNGAFRNVHVPSIIFYVYNRNGFYFATSPILVILSLVSLVIFILRR